ncbi:hypothetical protein B0H34DRAFT_804544 [Crassisporium funariophilum]|nr:hypothetical protein B0H34DRAFT_804544 [Crassisporium funariophilum]
MHWFSEKFEQRSAKETSGPLAGPPQRVHYQAPSSRREVQAELELAKAEAEKGKPMTAVGKAKKGKLVAIPHLHTCTRPLLHVVGNNNKSSISSPASGILQLHTSPCPAPAPKPPYTPAHKHKAYMDDKQGCNLWASKMRWRWRWREKWQGREAERRADLEGQQLQGCSHSKSTRKGEGARCAHLDLQSLPLYGAKEEGQWVVCSCKNTVDLTCALRVWFRQPQKLSGFLLVVLKDGRPGYTVMGSRV